MEVKFDSDQQPITQNKTGNKTNFVSKLILRTSLVKNPKVANNLSLIFAVILFAVSLVVLNQLLAPKEIDSRHYFIPTNTEPGV
jgi:hypothetical protein